MMIALIFMTGGCIIVGTVCHLINKVDMRRSMDEEKKRTHEIQMQSIRYPNR